MNHTTRLRLGHYWRAPETPARSVHLDAGTLLRLAQFDAQKAAARPDAPTAPSIENLQLLRRDKEGNKNDSGATEYTWPVTLASKDYFPAANAPFNWHEKAAWSGTGAADLVELPRPFADGAGLGYTRSEPNLAATLVSPPNLLLENTPFTLRLYLFTPPDDPNAESEDEYEKRFRIVFGDWTFFLEGQNEKIQHASWLEAKSLNLGGEWFNRPLKLRFWPEPSGLLTAQRDNGRSDSVQLDTIVSSREPGIVWPDGRVVLWRNGGAFLFQAGYPQFAPSGKAVYPELFDCEIVSWQAHVPPGASLSRGEDGALLFAPDAGRRRAPLLYSAHGTDAAMPRVLSDESVLDTDAVAVQIGYSPILEVDVQHDGKNRRRQFEITLSDPQGEATKGIGGGNLFGAMENRIVELFIDGGAVMKRGIVIAASYDDMAHLKYANGPLVPEHPWTEVRLTLCDMWFLLDEDLIFEDPIGDGVRLGAYVKTLLRNCGFPEAWLAGVSENAGRILPHPALGEAPIVRPRPGDSRGDWLREVVEKWGMGLILWVDEEGIWRLDFPSEATVAVFNDGVTEGDRFRILAPLSGVRETDDFYNVFRVEGAEVNGVRLAAEWTIHESYDGSGATASRKYIGRWRKHPVVRDDDLRTLDDVAWVLRSLVKNKARPPRYWTFEAFFQRDLMPGQRVMVGGLPCEIERIARASLNEDMMSIAVREVE